MSASGDCERVTVKAGCVSDDWWTIITIKKIGVTGSNREAQGRVVLHVGSSAGLPAPAQVSGLVHCDSHENSLYLARRRLLALCSTGASCDVRRAERAAAANATGSHRQRPQPVGVSNIHTYTSPHITPYIHTYTSWDWRHVGTVHACMCSGGRLCGSRELGQGKVWDFPW